MGASSDTRFVTEWEQNVYDESEGQYVGLSMYSNINNAGQCLRC